MRKRPIRVLLVDDDVDYCLLQRRGIEQETDMECCGTAYDGQQALRLIDEQRPDIVVLDCIMPVLDGVGVLRYAAEHPERAWPHFLIISAGVCERLIREMNELGAAYYLPKPFAHETLLFYIRLFCTPEGEHSSHISQDDVEHLVDEELLAIGIPTKRLGYEYIRRALCILLRRDTPRPSFKQIYEKIAEECSSDSRCVENAISTAIKAATDMPRPGMTELLKMEPPLSKHKMSNGIFLTLLAKKICLRMF